MTHSPHRPWSLEITHFTSTQFLVGYALGAVAGAVIFLHADRNGSRHPTLWAVSAFFFLGLALPVYLCHVYRQRHVRRL